MLIKRKTKIAVAKPFTPAKKCILSAADKTVFPCAIESIVLLYDHVYH